MNLFYKFFFVLLPISIFSQVDYGFKAGINLNNSSDISTINQEIDLNVTEDDFKGFFIGSFISVEGAVFNLRTELQYNKTKNNINLIQNKIELPITIGYKVLPFLSVFIGPSFQYILNEKIKISSFNTEKIEDNTTMGLNLGTRIHLGKIQFDIRYERGLNSMETKIIHQNNLDIVKIDNRVSILTIGFAYKLNDED